MHTDILDLHHFYQSALGMQARTIIADHIKTLWGEAENERIAGFGYVTPYLGSFPQARATIAMAPDAQGVMRWPHDHQNPQPNKICLIHEDSWPLPDRTMDKVLIVHGLEEARDISRLLREAWRVLADDGRLIIVAAQRRGFWASFDTTPMAAGRPWLRGQLGRFLERSLFTPLVWRRALHFPPLYPSLFLRGTHIWEKLGQHLWPGFCGMLIVEANKSLMHPAKGTPQRVLNVIRPKLSGPLLPAATLSPPNCPNQNCSSQNS